MRSLGEVLFGKGKCSLLQSQPDMLQLALKIKAGTLHLNLSPEEIWDAAFIPACSLKQAGCHIQYKLELFPYEEVFSDMKSYHQD